MIHEFPQPDSQSQCELSIVVPTYCEAENLPKLFQRLDQTLNESGLRAEVVVVDDNSDDGTEFVCMRYGKSLPIRLYVRKHDRGLSSAVVLGMKKSKGETICVMDADLSHPPERIPALYEALTQQNECTDFVIGSRYVEGGSTTDDWGFLRWLNSRLATLAARPFTSASDPMAGFFAMHRRDFIRSESLLNPIGYKIGLELMVKCDLNHVVEVPIRFSNRIHGESKLTLQEQLNYVKHLVCLFRHKYPSLGRLAFLPNPTIQTGSASSEDISPSYDSTEGVHSRDAVAAPDHLQSRRHAA
ncbi:polyprenol monophosphomannose synthase [Rubripirellula amarantea]|uniref:Undecaprenyl-phosphate mannosyltransferase n=1 Tax=Rubripirellula amarantea TaxID=2527999 RepID=A0A5C5WSV4_9BACT|nr:polyprenol monophosphomannose synthase [Rubripirellula amarantea]MDA8744169.1 polyprenol monophosphomannose synthase [Rubripirellula amarantea]TWT53241.1 Undecaprenyl-phosphate mannosyltransferase [Rubripirellula amarantea]